MLRPSAGIAGPPSTATPMPRTTSVSYTAMAGGVPQDYAEAVKLYRKAAEQVLDPLNAHAASRMARPRQHRVA